jgi:hypothetical protein
MPRDPRDVLLLLRVALAIATYRGRSVQAEDYRDAAVTLSRLPEKPQQSAIDVASLIA